MAAPYKMFTGHYDSLLLVSYNQLERINMICRRTTTCFYHRRMNKAENVWRNTEFRTGFHYTRRQKLCPPLHRFDCSDGDIVVNDHCDTQWWSNWWSLWDWEWSLWYTVNDHRDYSDCDNDDHCDTQWIIRDALYLTVMVTLVITVIHSDGHIDGPCMVTMITVIQFNSKLPLTAQFFLLASDL